MDSDRKKALMVGIAGGGIALGVVAAFMLRQGGVSFPVGVPSVTGKSVPYTFLIWDSEKGAAVPNLRFTIGPYHLTSNSQGKADLNLPFGDYTFGVVSSGYEDSEFARGRKTVISSSDIDLNILELEGATRLQQKLLVEGNTPVIDAEYVLANFGIGQLAEYPGCGGCEIKKYAWTQCKVIDKKGRPLANYPVILRRLSSGHDHRIRSGKWGSSTQKTYYTDSNGLTPKVDMAPAYYGRCGYGIGPDAAKCAKGSTQWEWQIVNVSQTSRTRTTVMVVFA